MGALPKDVPGTDPVINRMEAAKNPFDDTVFLISVFLAKDNYKLIPENFQYIAWITVSRFIKQRKEIQHVGFNYPTEQLRARWKELRDGYNQNQEAGDVPLDIWNGVFDDTNFKVPPKYKQDSLAKYPLSGGDGDGGAGSSGGGSGGVAESSGGGGAGGAESSGGVKPKIKKETEINPEVQNEQDSGERVTIYGSGQEEKNANDQDNSNQQNEQGGVNGGSGRGGGGDGGSGTGGGGDGGSGTGGGGDGGSRIARRNRCCGLWWF